MKMVILSSNLNMNLKLLSKLNKNMARSYRKYNNSRSYNSRVKQNMQEQERYFDPDLEFQLEGLRISGKKRWKKNLAVEFDDYE